MICDWKTNQECLFLRESSIKIDVFRVRREKRSEEKTIKNKSLQELKNESFWPPEEVPDRLSYPPSVDLSNTTWAHRELIIELARNTCGSHGTKATIK